MTLRMEDFMPLWSSLEREQYTLQRLNSAGDEIDNCSDGQRSSSPSSVWSTDSMDDEMYLEYLFSQGLADSLEKTISEIPSIVCEESTNFNQFHIKEQDFSESQSINLEQTVPDDTFNILEQTTSEKDFVVLGVGLQNLMHNYAAKSVPTTTNSNLQEYQIDFPIRTQPPTITRVNSKPYVNRTQYTLASNSLLTQNSLLNTVKMRNVKAPAQRACVSKDKSEEKIYHCTYAGCNKVYSKSSHLKAHLRRHTGEKPFECTWPGCGWRFSRSDELARHKRSHSGIKPYQCKICDKKFSRSDHLSKHLKVHRKR